MIANIAFRIVLVIVGAVSAVIAVNVAFGGLHTLGWQGPTDYFTVTDEANFAIRDNHARFFGGVMLALGAFFILAATNPRRYRGALLLAITLMFAGGLARFTQFELGVTFGPAIIVSALVELVLMPVLAVWVWKLEPGPKVSRVPSGVGAEPVA